MEIKHTTIEDIESAFGLYRAAVDYQRINGYNLWPEFERSLIEKEINEKRHYKIVDGNEIACVFSVVYNDPVIWEEKDKEASVYLHRIATNPTFKGKGIMQLIKKWAADHARSQGRKFLRMDTWGDNEKLKEYYIRCGFNYLGKKHLPLPNPLPRHYWGSTLSLFEIAL
jgi:GNAT superfamily N-acetyltransferase